MAKKKKNSDGYDGDSYDTGGQLTLDDQLFEADKKHYRDTEQYVGQVDYLYKQAITDLANLASQMQQLPQSQSFEFSRNPRLAAAADSTIRTLAARIEAVVDAGCRHEWEAACIKGDQYIQRIHATSGLSKEQTQRYQDRNLEALAAFQERKVEGLNLSERVWKMVSPLKDEVELAVDTSAKYFDHGTGINTTDAIGKIQSAIGTGMSAADLSRDVRQCLLEPNRLFRRVKDKHGNLTLSKAAKLYHPGQGVYRSSYKNAMRLTRSEINMAYRQSDTMRWQQLDFVVGMEVHTSNNHTTPDPKGHGRLQLIDICDELKGKYPRDFKFVGWHPQCRCYMTPILKTREEMNEDRANADDPSYIPKPSVNAVNNTPEGFHQYMKENEERMKGWSSTPYYIKDNPHYFDKALHPEKYQVQALTLTTEQSKALSEFQAYGNSHQSSKKFAAAMERAQKAQLAGDTDGFEAAMKEMEKIQKTNERVAEYHQKKREQKPNPKEQRHQFDDRIEAIKAKAAQYPGKAIDITSIQEAYTQLDLARLQKAIEAQEEVVRRHEKVLAAAEKRHQQRTQADVDSMQTNWNLRRVKAYGLDKYIDKAEELVYTHGIDRKSIDEFLKSKQGKNRSEFSAKVFNLNDKIAELKDKAIDMSMDKLIEMWEVQAELNRIGGAKANRLAEKIGDYQRKVSKLENRTAFINGKKYQSNIDSVKRQLEDIKSHRDAVRERVKEWQKTRPKQEQTKLKNTIDTLNKSKIDRLEVKALDKPLSDEEIIARVAGGDRTEGSCSSLALCFAGNKGGLDVLDFRDGESRKFFATRSNIKKIVESVGGFTEYDKDDNEASKRLWTHMQEGKYYYFVTGGHAAIIRIKDIGTGGKKKMVREYLELQSPYKWDNKFKPLNKQILKSRFCAEFDNSYERSSYIVDIDLLTNDPGFRKMLEYINTEASKQVKGKGGGTK